MFESTIASVIEKAQMGASQKSAKSKRQDLGGVNPVDFMSHFEKAQNSQAPARTSHKPLERSQSLRNDDPRDVERPSRQNENKLERGEHSRSQDARRLQERDVSRAERPSRQQDNRAEDVKSGDDLRKDAVVDNPAKGEDAGVDAQSEQNQRSDGQDSCVCTKEGEPHKTENADDVLSQESNSGVELSLQDVLALENLLQNSAEAGSNSQDAFELGESELNGEQNTQELAQEVQNIEPSQMHFMHNNIAQQEALKIQAQDAVNSEISLEQTTSDVSNIAQVLAGGDTQLSQNGQQTSKSANGQAMSGNGLGASFETLQQSEQTELSPKDMEALLERVQGESKQNVFADGKNKPASFGQVLNENLSQNGLQVGSVVDLQTKALAGQTIAAAVAEARGELKAHQSNSNIPVEIASAALRGKNAFEIRMDPPELGRLRVRLEVNGAGKVKGKLIVERPEALEMLQRDLPRLREALELVGLKTDASSFDLSLAGGQKGQGQESARQEFDFHSFANSEEFDEGQNVRLTLERTRETISGSMSRVDVMV